MSRAIDRIIAEVAARHELQPRDLTGDCRFKHFCRARFEAMWLARQLLRADGSRLYSLPQIGKHFNRDHTAVLNALRRFETGTGRMAA